MLLLLLLPSPSLLCESTMEGFIEGLIEAELPLRENEEDDADDAVVLPCLDCFFEVLRVKRMAVPPKKGNPESANNSNPNRTAQRQTRAQESRARKYRRINLTQDCSCQRRNKLGTDTSL